MESQILCRSANVQVWVLSNSSVFRSLHPTNVLNAYQASWRTRGASLFQFVGELSTSSFHYILTQSFPYILILCERRWRHWIPIWGSTQYFHMASLRSTCRRQPLRNSYAGQDKLCTPAEYSPASWGLTKRYMVSYVVNWKSTKTEHLAQLLSTIPRISSVGHKLRALSKSTDNKELQLSTDKYSKWFIT